MQNAIVVVGGCWGRDEKCRYRGINEEKGREKGKLHKNGVKCPTIASF